MTKVLDELRCDICKAKLSHKQPLFETAWSGIFWCGKEACAFQIMQNECRELSTDDPTNRE